MFGFISKTVLPSMVVGGVLIIGYQMAEPKALEFEILNTSIVDDPRLEVDLNFIEDGANSRSRVAGEGAEADVRCHFRISGPFEWIDTVDAWIRADGEVPVRLPASLRMLNESSMPIGNGRYTFVDRGCAVHVDVAALEDFDVAIRVKALVDGMPETFERVVQIRRVRPRLLD